MRKIIILLTSFLSVIAVCAQTAKEYLEQGNLKLETEDHSGAIIDYTKAIQLNPKCAEAPDFVIASP